MSESTQSRVDVLLSVAVEVSVEVGRCSMRVRDVLQVGPGSVISLDRAAGAPVDVLVNGKLIARGEVVAVDERYGIRVVEVVGRGAVSAPQEPA
jgi:flagellar motor switch protein FliN/FliY